jgi:hypothetical protein
MNRAETLQFDRAIYVPLANSDCGQGLICLVAPPGVEPGRLSAADFKSDAKGPKLAQDHANSLISQPFAAGRPQSPQNSRTETLQFPSPQPDQAGPAVGKSAALEVNPSNFSKGLGGIDSPRSGQRGAVGRPVGGRETCAPRAPRQSPPVIASIGGSRHFSDTPDGERLTSGRKRRHRAGGAS